MQGKFWAFILLLGVTVFSIMLYFLFTASNEQIAAQDIPNVGSGEVIVNIEKNGYNPENITVKSGTQVKWVNRDTEPHFVAFSLKTSLDNLTVINQELQSGETLTYKFESAGEFGYFDKLGKLVGRVTVK